ncbi:MAG TPA: single-stranded DNA-binding protein, partial [Elusimicrobiales bacterium]|nr:single-stranded DNA-binding protein [Elusimicrobiales bacterium]
AAERCKEKLKKGSPVHVEGRLTLEEWTDKSGQKRKNIIITSRRLQFLAYSPTGEYAKQQEATQSQSTAPVSPSKNESAETATDLDDVPF